MWWPTRAFRNVCWPTVPPCRCASDWSVPTTTQVVAALEEHRDTYTQRLAEIAGCREYHLKVARDEDDLLREIVRESAEVRRLNERTRQNPDAYDDKVALGELISQEVQARQDRARTDIVALLDSGRGTHRGRRTDEASFPQRVLPRGAGEGRGLLRGGPCGGREAR